MMLKSRAVASVVGTVAFWSGISSAAIAAPTEETLVLKQNCTAIGGIHTIYLRKDSLRIESRSMNIFAQAPKWTITVLNLKKKFYLQSDFQSGLKKIKQARTPFNVIAESRAVKWQKVKAETIAGQTTEQWFGQGGGDRNKSSAKCWTLPESQSASQCAEILATYYGLPVIGHGVPLRFLYKGTGNSLLLMPTRQFDQDGVREQEYPWLDTTSIKKEQTATALFSIPPGFKATKNYAEIAVDGDTHSGDAQFILKDLAKHPEALFDSR